MRILIVTFTLVLSQTIQAQKIYDTLQQKWLSLNGLSKKVQHFKGTIVLGEEHYNSAIQKAQGKIISQIVKSSQNQSNFSVSWEFLNHPDQKRNKELFLKWKQKKIDDKELFSKLFPKSKKPEINLPYIAFFKALAQYEGELISTNAPRSWKSVITQSGINNLDPEKIPANYELGNLHYFERFKVAIQDHVPTDKVPYYFQAQSYTDSVMAWAIDNFNKKPLNFLIVGSFHSDYQDGVVEQINKIGQHQSISIKMIQGKDLSPEEIKKWTEPHPRYGKIADYIYFTL